MKFSILIAILFAFVASENDVDEFFKSRCDPNCTFSAYHISSKTLKLFPSNCSSVCAYIEIDKNSDVTEAQMTKAFKNMKGLNGYVNIIETNFTSLKFLAGLETLECDNGDTLLIRDNLMMTEVGMVNLTSTSCYIDIRYNYNMTQLNTPKLKNFYSLNYTESVPDIWIENSEKIFKISIEEVTRFLSNDNIGIYMIVGSYPQWSGEPTFDGDKICDVGTLNISSFDTSCKRIFGNVNITSANEAYVDRLKNITWVYGWIEIRETNLESIDFFDSLQYVMNVDYGPGIYAWGNSKLQQATFPSLKRAKDAINFNENHEKLVWDPNVCYRTIDSRNVTEQRKAYINVDDCETLVKDGRLVEIALKIRSNATSASSPERNSKVKTLCKDFPKCLKPLKCGKPEDVKSLVDQLASFCEILAFKDTTEYTGCNLKLDPMKSKCVKEWNPFPARVDDMKKMKEIQAESCKNFFGKDNCMEKEITHKCGFETWQKFRKHYLNLNSLNNACDLH